MNLRHNVSIEYYFILLLSQFLKQKVIPTKLIKCRIGEVLIEFLSPCHVVIIPHEIFLISYLLFPQPQMLLHVTWMSCRKLQQNWRSAGRHHPSFTGIQKGSVTSLDIGKNRFFSSLVGHQFAPLLNLIGLKPHTWK